MIVDLSDKQKTQYEYKREREKKILLMRGIISSWKKRELREYVYGHNKLYRCSDAGMAAILERFINTNEFKIGDMAEEIKEGLDIVLAISRNHKISLLTTDLIYSFIKHFEDVIKSYDRQSAQTYQYKLKEAYKKSLELVEAKTGIEKEMSVKY
jgi:hypothetical protein